MGVLDRFNPRTVTDAFNAAEDRAYQRDERDYVTRERFKAEGVDAAKRRAGLAAFPENEPVQTPASPVPAAPAAAPASPMLKVVAPPLPTGADSAGGDAGQLQELTRGAPPVVAPASRSAMTPSMAAAGLSGAAQFAAATPPPAAAPAPAAVQSNAQPAAVPPASQSAAVPPPSSAQPARRPSGMGSIIRGMASTPGMGDTMMQMYAADRQDQRVQAAADQRMKIEMEKEVYNHIKNGDWQVAQSISERYKLGIPPEIFAHRGIQQLMTAGANAAGKLLGTKAPFESHMAFSLEYAKVVSQGGSEDQAVQAGVGAAQKAAQSVGFNNKGHFVGPDNQVMFYNEHGGVQPSGFRARQSARDGGGGNSVFQQKYALYLKAYGGDERRALDAANGRKPMAHAEMTRIALGIVAREAHDNFKLRQDPAKQAARVQEIIGQLADPGDGEGAPAPSPAPRSPAAAPAAAAAPAPAAQSGMKIIDYTNSGQRAQ